MKECGCKHQSTKPMPIPCPYYPMAPMPMTPTPSAPTPSATMPEQLETMYPKTYNIIYPKVYQHCDMMEKTYGSMHCPTHEHMKSMVESICGCIEKEVEESLKVDTKEKEPEARQLGFYGRFLLRDLATILLIRELIRRRTPYGGYGYPGYGYPSFGYGYPGYGYGYPGYGYGYPGYGYGY